MTPEEEDFLPAPYQSPDEAIECGAIIDGKFSAHPVPPSQEPIEMFATRGVLGWLKDFLLGRRENWTARLAEAEVQKREADAELLRSQAAKNFAEAAKGYQEAEAIKSKRVLEEREKEIEHRERLTNEGIRLAALARLNSLKQIPVAGANVEQAIDNLEAQGAAFEASDKPIGPITANQFSAAVESTVPTDILNMPVGDLELSVRARKGLQRLNITTLAELASRTEAELLGLKNFGQTSLNEIKQQLSSVGLALRKLED